MGLKVVRKFLCLWVDTWHTLLMHHIWGTYTEFFLQTAKATATINLGIINMRDIQKVEMQTHKKMLNTSHYFSNNCCLTSLLQFWDEFMSTNVVQIHLHLPQQFSQHLSHWCRKTLTSSETCIRLSYPLAWWRDDNHCVQDQVCAEGGSTSPV